MNEKINSVLAQMYENIKNGNISPADQAAIKHYGEDIVAWVNVIIYFVYEEKVDYTEFKSYKICTDNIDKIEVAKKVIDARMNILSKIFGDLTMF